LLLRPGGSLVYRYFHCCLYLFGLTHTVSAFTVAWLKTSSSSSLTSSLHSHVNLEWCDEIKLANLLLPRKSGTIKSLQLLSTSIRFGPSAKPSWSYCGKECPPSCPKALRCYAWGSCLYAGTLRNVAAYRGTSLIRNTHPLETITAP